MRPDLNAAERKALPICTGVLDYFPDALAAVAHASMVGNAQHNPGEPLHWAKDKSADHADALMRHMVHRGQRDRDKVLHSAKVAWRALAMLQTELDGEPKGKAELACIDDPEQFRRALERQGFHVDIDPGDQMTAIDGGSVYDRTL